MPPTSPFHVWTTRPSRARVYFNDVAREIYPDANGLVGSVPSTLRRDVPSSFVFTDCYLPSSVASFRHVHLAVLLIDGRTGRIVNAAHLSNGTLTGLSLLRQSEASTPPHSTVVRRFDLSGRPQPTPQHGLNIENGQKVWR